MGGCFLHVCDGIIRFTAASAELSDFYESDGRERRKVEEG